MTLCPARATIQTTKNNQRGKTNPKTAQNPTSDQTSPASSSDTHEQSLQSHRNQVRHSEESLHRSDPFFTHRLFQLRNDRPSQCLRLLQSPHIMTYFNLLSYLYLSRLIHDASLIIYELSVPPAHLHHVYICMRTCVNAYRTYPLSRYLAVNYLTSQRVFSHSTFLFCTHIPTLT